MALFNGDGRNQWFPGRVTGFEKNDDGTLSYDIKYDDGDTDGGLHERYVSTNVGRFADKP